MNFFHHKGLGNHLLQLCPKVVKHPVYRFGLNIVKNRAHEELHLGMAMISAVGTDCLSWQVRSEAEETVDDVNVALERDSLLALCCETEETYRNKSEAKAPGMVTHIMKSLSVLATESQSIIVAKS